MNPIPQTDLPGAEEIGGAAEVAARIPVYVLEIAAIFLVTGLVIFLAPRLARWLIRALRLTSTDGQLTPARRRTLEQLLTSLVGFVAVGAALLAVLWLFVGSQQLIWIVGLFSAAFGLAARGIVADLLTGMTFIFRNTMAHGEKVEFVVGGNRYEGTIEEVNVRSTLLRSPTGELYTIPNSEIVVIRNFTRAQYSVARLTFNVATQDLMAALETLQALGEESVNIVPQMVEPWRVFVSEEAVGKSVSITVDAKLTFGEAARLKPELAALIYSRLHANGVALAD